MSCVANAPFPTFTGLDGKALEGGLIYIGVENLNPETNPITVYWDQALTQPAAQPIRTVAGYPARNGSPSQIFTVEASYSVTVRNSAGALVYSVKSMGGASLIGADDGASGTLWTTVQGFIDHTGPRIARIYNVIDTPYSADPTGAADSAAAFTSAASASHVTHVTAGTYKLNSSPASGVAATWIVEPGATFTGTGKLQSATSHVISYGGAYRGFASDTSIYTGIYGYLEQNSGLAVTAELAITGQTQSLGNGTTSGTYNIGLSALGLHNNVGSSGHVIGVYSTVARWSGVIGSTSGMEIDVANMGSTVQMHPANMFPAGQTMGAWIASGGELAANGVGSPGVASVAIGILQNDSQTVKTASFDKGIIFHNKAINGADGTGTIGCAIAYAVGHAQQWYNNSNQIIGEIVATGTTQANNNFRLDFSSYGLLVQDRASGQSAFSIAQVSSFVNGVQITPAATGGDPIIAASGSDANINLALLPKGTGLVKFGAYTAGALSPTGYVSIYTSDGALRRLLVG